MTPRQTTPPPDLATMDERCLDHDHSFPWLALYDDDEPPPTYEEQMAMKCARCGETMRHSVQRMAQDLKALLDSPGPA